MSFDEDSPSPGEVMPCAFGLLVGTLALMTAHASPEPEARVDATTGRRLMARKIVSNLFFLQHHPDTPPPLRQVAANMRARCLPMAGSSERATPANTAVPVAERTQWH